ncbi:hypothetical protein K438DRAFT_1981541 [Mycena galopus ATCC 62051]|nr:hypothetical protein K438DRAFT_1981541 [Mycena galopus ATCC 62051]
MRGRFEGGSREEGPQPLENVRRAFTWAQVAGDCEFSRYSLSTTPRRRAKRTPAPLGANVAARCVYGSSSLHQQISKNGRRPRPSDFLRVKLPPPRFDPPVDPLTTDSSWTKITDGQIQAADDLRLHDNWSVEPDLAVCLINAVASDLDKLLPAHASLLNGLKEVITTLANHWQESFADDSQYRMDNVTGLEKVTSTATKLLLQAVGKTFGHIQAIVQPPEPHVILFRTQTGPPGLSRTCYVDNTMELGAGTHAVDNTMNLDGDSDAEDSDTEDSDAQDSDADKPDPESSRYIAVVEDKRPRGFTSVLAELYQRANYGVFKSDIQSARDPDFVQRPLWILVNKGLFYVGLYKVNWIIFAGVTGFCVGYRTNKHMFWSGPVYNRRNKEFTKRTAHATSIFFGGAPPPTTKEAKTNDVFLLFLAVTLRGAHDKGECTWIRTQFEALCALSFTPPTPTDPSKFTRTGDDFCNTADPGETSPSGDSSGSDETYQPSGSERSSASTTLLLGRHQLTGRWYGDLGDPDDYGVKVLHLLASGYQNSVYAGELFQKDKSVAAVAIKASEDCDALMTEFQRYQALQILMGNVIPRCYGLCVRGNTAYLVTSLVPNDTPERELTKAERAAIYAALQKMHRAGWAHNDFVDDGSQSLRNLLWDSEGRPVLIDFETATRHTCRAGCSELIRLQKALRLKNHDIAIWAR